MRVTSGGVFELKFAVAALAGRQTKSPARVKTRRPCVPAADLRPSPRVACSCRRRGVPDGWRCWRRPTAQFWGWGNRAAASSAISSSSNNPFGGGGLAASRHTEPAAARARGAGRLFATPRRRREAGGRRCRPRRSWCWATPWPIGSPMGSKTPSPSARNSAIVRKHRTTSGLIRYEPAPRHRLAAGRARDHHGREAEIHRHDDRRQRPPVDPRARGGSAGPRSRRAATRQAPAAAPAPQQATPPQPTPSSRRSRAPISRMPSSHGRAPPTAPPAPARPAGHRSRSNSIPRSGKPPTSSASMRPSRR